MIQETCLGSYDIGVAEKMIFRIQLQFARIKMARSTMTINIRFSPRVEPFCGEDSLTVFSNVVPEREKKKENIHLIVF